MVSAMLAVIGSGEGDIILFCKSVLHIVQPCVPFLERDDGLIKSSVTCYHGRSTVMACIVPASFVFVTLCLYLRQFWQPRTARFPPSFRPIINPGDPSNGLRCLAVA